MMPRRARRPEPPFGANGLYADRVAVTGAWEALRHMLDPVETQVRGHIRARQRLCFLHARRTAGRAAMSADHVVKMVVDGAVDLPLPRSGVVSVPARIFKDRYPWSGEVSQFWSTLRSDPRGWSTAPPATDDLAEAYRNHQPALAVHVSAELSTTVEHGRAAAAAAGVPVTVCDSRSLSVGAGLVVTGVHGAQPLVEPVSKVAADLIARTHTYVLVDQVDYLLRSGRLGLLEGEHVKSRRHYLLAVRGHAIPLGHSRTRERAFASLLDHLLGTAPNGVEAWALSHGSADDVESLTAQAGRTIGLGPEFLVLLDPTVGIHVGPDAVIVAARGRAAGH